MSQGAEPAGAVPVGSDLTPSPAALLAVAEAAGWPHARIYALELATEAAWRRVLAGCPSPAPGECRVLAEALGAPWASDALVATDASRARLGRWFAAGRQRPSVDAVPFVGDNMLTAGTRGVLARLPAPVLDHVRRNAVVLTVGRSCAGFCAVLPAPAADASEARRLLVCQWTDDVAFESVVAHEICHHWLEAAPSADHAPRTEAATLDARDDREALLALAREWDLLPRLTDPAERAERQACRLAEAWGFRQWAEGCAQNMREGLRRAAAAAVLPPSRRS
jgi:hypothetical protein